MKFLLLLLICLSLSSLKKLNTNDSFIDEFYTACDEEYSYYKVIANESNSTFDYIIVQGLINDVACYGVCYTNNSGNYTFNISYGGSRYRFNKTDNNNSYCVAIKSEEPIKGFITDSKGSDKELFALKVFFTNQFDKTNAITGNGNVKKFNDFSLMKMRSRIITVIIYASASTILLFGLGTLIIFLIRHHQFKKEKSEIGNMNIKDLLNEESSNKFDEESIFDQNDIKTKNEEIVLDKDDYEEIKPNRDVKEILRNEGFITDYKVLSEDEKNQIMVKLMILKNNKEISLEDYQKETKELWKK